MGMLQAAPRAALSPGEPPRDRIVGIARRIAMLEAENRRRPLADAEVQELVDLLEDQQLRLRRLPVQIAACEAKLLRLRAELAVLAGEDAGGGR